MIWFGYKPLISCSDPRHCIDRCSYFAELRRQALASTAVYTAMIDTCQHSAEIKNLLSQMEADGIKADLHTYVALHRAWYTCAFCPPQVRSGCLRSYCAENFVYVRVVRRLRVRSSDLDAAMATFKVWDLPSATKLGMDAASRSTLLR